MSDITFVYKNETACMLGTRWDGCCCTCAYRKPVHKHCSHNEKTKEEGCICDTPLGFYVCVAMVESSTQVNLSGTHGFCELYKKLEPGKNSATPKIETEK